MVFKNNKPSSFYSAYVKDIQAKICENGRLEFEAIWSEYVRRVSSRSRSRRVFFIPPLLSTTLTDPFSPRFLLLEQKGAVARSLLSDELSSGLNALQVELEESILYEQVESTKAVLKKAIPKTLIDKVGVETLMKRLPEQVSRFSLDASSSSLRFADTPCLPFALAVPPSSLVGLRLFSLHLLERSPGFSGRFLPLHQRPRLGLIEPFPFSPLLVLLVLLSHHDSLSLYLYF